MRNERTYSDQGVASMLRGARSGMTKEQMRTGGLTAAKRRKIAVVDGVERADLKLKRFSWDNEE